jgi:hypothetical protein
LALAIPYGVGEFSGTVVDAPKHGRRSGFLDSSLRFSVNLIGGPAMDPQEFTKWRQDILLGVSLKIVAPTRAVRPDGAAPRIPSTSPATSTFRACNRRRKAR